MKEWSSQVVITSITIGGLLLLIGSHQKEKVRYWNNIKNGFSSELILVMVGCGFKLLVLFYVVFVMKKRITVLM